WTPSSDTCIANGSHVPAGAVAGHDASVAVRLAVPAELVYATVVFVIAPTLPVADEHSHPRKMPSPLGEAALSRAGHGGGGIAWAPVVVTTGTLPHSLSTSQIAPTLPAWVNASRSR